MRIKLHRKIVTGAGYQIFFWSALLLFDVLRSIGENNELSFKGLLVDSMCHWIFQVISANFIYFVLVRRFYDRKRYFLFFILLIFSLLGFSVLNRIYVLLIYNSPLLDFPLADPENLFKDIKGRVFHYLFPILTGSFTFVISVFILRYNRERQKTIQLEKEKSELELKVLKAQLNPHFLFNTLNNIYSLALNHSEQVPQSIGRLSDILDYILYKGQRQTVLVEEEMRIINDFIGLEKLRYDERLSIEITENITSPQRIPPLIYLSLVENAFKHSVEKTAGEIEIRISVFTRPGHTVFKVENTFFAGGPGKNTRTGIGLENISRQLNLFYKRDYSLRAEEESGWFKVEVITPS